jgi:hypothetical protein
MDNNLITELDEQRIDELLEYVPGYSQENSEKIKSLFLQKAAKKHGSGRRVFLVAAVIAIAAALSGIALAVSFGFDFGRIINSFFNNPSVGNKVEVGETVTANGIDVTLVSAVFDENMAYVLINIKGLEGKQLTSPIRLLNINNKYSYHILYEGYVFYDEKEDIATVPLTLIFTEPIHSGDILEISIDAILSGNEYIESKVLDFDISANAVNNKTISEEEWSIIASDGAELPGVAGVTGNDLPDGLSYRDDGLPIIPLLELDKMEVKIGGIDWAVVTNAGIVDGLLHLQTKYTASYNGDYNYGFLHLLSSDGSAIQSFYDRRIGAYHESVFDVRGIDLDAIQLAVSGPEFENVLLGPWNMSFTADQKMPKRTITVNPAESLYFEKIDITYSPLATSFEISLTGNDEWDVREYLSLVSNYIKSFEPPYYSLTDGSVITLDMHGMMVDPTIGSADYRSEYFDIEKLRSITFCGEEYFFSSNT